MHRHEHVTYQSVITRILVIGLAVLLSDCSGGGGQASVPTGSLASAGDSASTIKAVTPTSVPQGGTTTSVPTPQMTSGPASSGSSATNAQPVPVQFTYTYTLASATPSTQVTPNIGMQSHIRRVLSNAAYVGYTSTAAPISISLNVTPVGGSTSNYTGSCTAAASGTSGTCSVSFTASPGPTTIAGTLTESGNTIATFSNISIIQPSTTNSLNFTVNPVVASVAVVLSAPTTYLNTTLNQTLPAVTAGTAYDVPLVVNAYDANGNIIAGTKSYVDSSGTPISLILSVKNSQAGGRGTVYIKGPSRITAPGQAAIYAHYDGNWLDYSTISVSSTSSAVTTSGGSATLTTIPYAYEYSAHGSNPLGIVTGPDGNLWYALWNVAGPNAAIGKMTPAGQWVASYPCSPCGHPTFLANGPDGNIWFTENDATTYIDKITISGVVTRVAAAAVGWPSSIVAGPDGNMWYTSSTSNFVGKISMTGAITNYPTGFSARGMAVGPDRNLWFLSASSTSVGVINTKGAIVGTYPIASDGPASDGLVTGPDGNLWLVNYGSNAVESIIPGGSPTSHGLTGNAAPRDIVVGPDGALWFTEQGTNGIGKITTSGSLSEYNLTNGNNINGSSAPIGITLGSDGNIWFAETGSNTIAKFVF